MVGTTRSRVSFFMNRFRKLGLIEYNGRIRVHKALLNVVLHDQFTERNPRDLPVRLLRVFDQSRPNAPSMQVAQISKRQIDHESAAPEPAFQTWDAGMFVGWRR